MDGGRRFLEGGHITILFAIRTTPEQKTCPKGPFHKCSVPTDRFSRTLPHDERPPNGNYVPTPVDRDGRCLSE